MLLHRHDVELWHDRRIETGSDWRERIARAIDHAAAALLLVSPHFLASDFVREDELPRLEYAARHRQLKVLPIIVEACAWRDVGWLAGMQVCMVHDRPLSAATAGETEAAFATLASELNAYLDVAPAVSRRTRAERTNIPPSSTTFIGRSQELEELNALLANDVRLITLTGSPGLGKTRLARQLGRTLVETYPGGCWFVNLVVAVTLTGIAHAIAQAFGVALTSAQVSEQEAIVELLRNRPACLLILDNFEQVVALAGDSVGYWLERLPNVQFVVTSREVLNLAGEREYRLESLPVPPREPRIPEEIVRYESASLFLDRAAPAWPAFALDEETAPAVARICNELQGIPLAIELAAARARIFSAAEIADRLGEKFSLLAARRRGAHDRQQTLRASIDWSFNLLNAWEQQAFLQLCIFRGGFFLDAAERIVDLSPFAGAPPVADVVQGLFEKSLVNQHQTRYGRRFDLLVAIREYGQERWQQAASDDLREALARRWAAYYIPYVQAWNAKVHTAEAVKALDLLTLELENVFDIQDWFLAHGDPATAASAILAFSETMALRGPAQLRVPRLEKSLVAVPESETELRVRLLTALSAAHWSVGEWNVATELTDQAIDLAARTGSSLAAAAALRWQGRIRTDRGYLRRALMSLERARAMYEEIGNRGGMSVVAGDLAGIFDRLGAFPRALALVDEAEAAARAENDEAQRALVLNRRGLVLWHHGHAPEALEALEEAERINTRIGATAWIGAHRTNQGLALVDLDQIDTAMERFASSERIHSELRTQAWLAVNYGGWGRAFMMRGRAGDLDAALAMFGKAAEISRRVYYPENISQHAGDIGRCLMLLGRPDDARAAVREALALERVIGASKDLRHFGNLVTLARVASTLGRDEECNEAVMRARELLAGGLPVGRAHPVRRVREDAEALEELSERLMRPEDRRISVLAQRHGLRPPDLGELEAIDRLVAESFDEVSYEYPWNGLEDDMRAGGTASLLLFGYGSLVNRESAMRTFRGSAERFAPAIAFGVVRAFEYEMPDVVRARYVNVSEKDPARGLLNVQVTGFVSDVANGVVIEAALEEIEGLRQREVGYDLRPIVTIEWNDGSRSPRLAYVLTAPNRLWRGRPLTNVAMHPYPPYYRQCLEGAASVSEAFCGFWVDTTFLADGRPLPPA